MAMGGMISPKQRCMWRFLFLNHFLLAKKMDNYLLASPKINETHGKIKKETKSSPCFTGVCLSPCLSGCSFLVPWGRRTQAGGKEDMEGWMVNDIQHGDDDEVLTSRNGYGSIPITTIFRGMNIHLPAILMFTRGTRF
jgi:hypothetical protein